LKTRKDISPPSKESGVTLPVWQGEWERGRICRKQKQNGRKAGRLRGRKFIQ